MRQHFHNATSKGDTLRLASMFHRNTKEHMKYSRHANIINSKPTLTAAPKNVFMTAKGMACCLQSCCSAAWNVHEAVRQNRAYIQIIATLFNVFGDPAHVKRLGAVKRFLERFRYVQ